jgi:hypothetical protein
MDTKPKIVNNVEPTSDISASLENLQLIVDGMVKVLDHVVIDANGLITWDIVGSYVIDVNGLV